MQQENNFFRRIKHTHMRDGKTSLQSINVTLAQGSPLPAPLKSTPLSSSQEGGTETPARWPQHFRNHSVVHAPEVTSQGEGTHLGACTELLYQTLSCFCSPLLPAGQWKGPE